MAASNPCTVTIAGLLLVGTAAAEPVINELLPDPAGADAGREFVELHNPDSRAVALDGVRLEFANGADGSWQVRWTAAAGEVLEAGARFLIVDAGWDGAARADAEVRLALQNGPDAVRLVRGEVVLDLVGYGADLAPELSENAPAVPVTGRSLARRPDGRDSGDNAADFVPASPTPGTVNFQRWRLETVGLTFEPPSLVRPGDEVDVVLVVAQVGWDRWPAGSVRCAVGGEVHLLDWPGCDPDGEVELAWRARPDVAGRVAVSGEFTLPDGSGWQRLEAGALQVGPAAVVLSEVMAVPRDGQGEWIELAVLAPGELGDLRLRDGDGDWRSLPPRSLAAGELIVLAADPVALLGREEEQGAGSVCTPPAARIVGVPDWPALNNTAPAGRAWADRVHLGDARGLILDHVTLGGDGSPPPAGRTRERVDLQPLHPVGDNWATCTAPAGGTPGCANSVSAPGGISQGLTASPCCLDPAAGVGAVHLRFTTGVGEDHWRVVIHDLWGAPVRSFGDDGLGPGPRQLVWAGEDDAGRGLPPGAYVAALILTGERGGIRRRERILVVVR